MKMCEKCWDHDCVTCDEMMGCINYHLAQIQLETGVGYYELLDAVEEWYGIKVKEWNRNKADALEIVRKRIEKGEI